MKADKVRELDKNEILNQVKDIPEQMFRIKFQLSMGQTDGVKKLRNLRKDRARMLTILSERELNPEKSPEPVATKKKKGK
jgi:large subunit ribosomal protein L29